MAGVVVGGCRLDRLLGRGGMGTVYRATQLTLGREVAVKVVPASDVEPALVARFKREARTAASLEHAHSIPIYAAGEEDGLLYLVMRLVHGPDLGALIAREGALAPARAVALIEQVAGALDAAHAAGLVHRDVKPGNILVEHEAGEQAYLSDFGLMRRAVDATAITRVDEWVGSIDYVAPEQVEGRPVDPRADIYSLTGVLYTALTGERPFPRDNPTATAWAHVNSPRPQVSGPSADEINAVIARGMAVRPQDRFGTAGELAASARGAVGGGEAVSSVRPLARPAADEPTEVHTRRLAPNPTRASASAPVAPLPPRARRRWGWAALIAIALGAAAVVAAVVLFASPARVRPPRSAPPVAQALRYPGHYYTFSYPRGWHLVQDEIPIGSFFRTEIINPTDTESVLIDRTPGENISPEAKSVQVQRPTEQTAGYQPIASHSTTIAGHDAFVWEFSLPGPGPGPAKIDIFLRLGTTDYAVLGSAATISAIEPITMSVAGSLSTR